MSDLLDKKCTIEKCWICAKCCLYYPPNDKSDFVLAKPDLIEWRLNNGVLSSSVSEKALMLDILKRYETGEIVESGETKEKERMENKEIIKELDEAILQNKQDVRPIVSKSDSKLNSLEAAQDTKEKGRSSPSTRKAFTTSSVSRSDSISFAKALILQRY